MKPSVFKRYLETATGSGRGLSIVHALVTDRYRGRVAVRDRVPGDHAKGSTIDLWLPSA
jgi:signal transduction histidine kinase